MRQYFDDGSYLDYDATYNVVGGADNRGGVIAAPGSGVVQQVMDLLSLGVKSAIYSKYGAAAQQAAAPAQTQQSQIVGIAIIAGLGLLAYKALS